MSTRTIRILMHQLSEIGGEIATKKGAMRRMLEERRPNLPTMHTAFELSILNQLENKLLDLIEICQREVDDLEQAGQDALAEPGERFS